MNCNIHYISLEIILFNVCNSPVDHSSLVMKHLVYMFIMISLMIYQELPLVYHIVTFLYKKFILMYRRAFVHQS